MTDLRRITDDAINDLTAIADWFQELLDDAIPGTRRRWHQRRDSDEQAAARLTRDRAEREARFGLNSGLPSHLKPHVALPPGASPSPGRDDVLDIITTVTFSVIEMRNAVADKLNAGRRRTPVAESCRWIASALPGINDPELVGWIAATAENLVRDVERGTGRLTEVIELDDNCYLCQTSNLQAVVERMSVMCTACQVVWPENQLVWLSHRLREGTETEEAS